MRFSTIALALFAARLGCAPSPAQWQDPAALDCQPPYLLAVSPESDAAPPAGCFTLRFSEPLRAAEISGHVVPSVRIVQERFRIVG